MERENLKNFITRNKIHISAKRTYENPYMPNSQNMDHWKVTLKMENRQAIFYFSMGFGHNGRKPTAYDVLSCLILDAVGIENNNSFESWADEYGLNTDSRKAEKSYRDTVRNTKKLKRLLGTEYETALWNTEE